MIRESAALYWAIELDASPWATSGALIAAWCVIMLAIVLRSILYAIQTPNHECEKPTR